MRRDREYDIYTEGYAMGFKAGLIIGGAIIAIIVISVLGICGL